MTHEILQYSCSLHLNSTHFPVCNYKNNTNLLNFLYSIKSLNECISYIYIYVTESPQPEGCGALTVEPLD